MNNNLSAVILAAGKGTRMKSEKPKVLHQLCGLPMLEWVYRNVLESGIEKCITVVGHKSEEIVNYMGEKVIFAIQEEQLGTGHAVMQTIDILKELNGEVIILNGDTPLITSETIKNICNYHKENNNDATILTADYKNPYGYGRIVRDEGNVKRIVEEKDASIDEKKITEINSGIYCFKINQLLNALDKISADNIQKEYYLTDTIEILINKGMKVSALKIKDNLQIFGINSRIHLAKAEKIMRQRILEFHMQNGVTMIDPDSTYINADVKIGNDTVIFPSTTIEAGSVIGKECNIGPNTRIINSTISNNTNIQFSVLINSIIGENVNVGPFAYLRPNTTIGNNVKIGDFVEIKNTKVGNNTKIPHLSYIGDSELGNHINIGCGAITVNYDGKNKHKTIIEDNSFVGCNVNLISPVKVKKNSYIAAGSTITEDVPANSLAIARKRQVVKEGWTKQKGLK